MTTSSNSTLVIDAISNANFKVSYKMKQTLLRIAKSSKTSPIESVEFGIEPLESNRHGNGYADYADVFYKYTAKNHYTTVGFDGKTAE